MNQQHQELRQFLDYVYGLSGYDFRDYSQASVERRIDLFKLKSKVNCYDLLGQKLESDKNFLHEFINAMTVQVTEMFRDPSFFKSMREKVIPILETYPRIKIWHAGCSIGTEAYSMAILLREEGLLERTRIYATDINQNSLKQGAEGRYDIKHMQAFTRNYQAAGGKCSLSDYYKVVGNYVEFDPSLAKHITFSFHNLATDWVFTEAHLILCRNVLIYFDEKLREKVFHLFDNGLTRRGFLALGNKESLKFTSIEKSYQGFDREEKIYRKVD